MFETRHIVFAGLMPFLLPLLLAWIETHRPHHRSSGWSLVTGIGAGYLLAWALALRWPALPPRQSVDWLAHAGVVLTAVALLDTWRPLHPAGRAAAVILVLAAMNYLLVRPLLDANRDPATEGWLILGFGTFVATAWWIGADALAARSDARTVLAAWALTAIAAALLMMLGGSQKIGLIAGPLAAGLTGATLVAWRRPSRMPARPVLVLIVPLLAGGLVAAQAWIVPPPPVWQLALLVLAPLLPWVVQLTPMRQWPPWRRVIVALLLVATPLVIVLTAAMMQFRRASAADSYPYY